MPINQTENKCKLFQHKDYLHQKVILCRRQSGIKLFNKQEWPYMASWIANQQIARSTEPSKRRRKEVGWKYHKGHSLDKESLKRYEQILPRRCKWFSAPPTLTDTTVSLRP